MYSLHLLILSIGLIGYYLLHSILAAESIKRLVSERFIAARYYRLIYNFLAIFLLLPLAWWYQHIESILIFEWRILSYLGLLIAATGLILLFFAMRQYNLKEFVGTHQLKKNIDTANVLKTGGFNAYVRHPLYFSGLLILWGWFLYQPTDAFLVVALISTVYLYLGTKLEEKKLLKVFGEAYWIYQQEVPMLLPLPKKKHQN
jgi:protein-S-isoprenylcysteine O-methyltransferase Ste14